MKNRIESNKGKSLVFHTDHRGFSLIELIIVVTIIGVLAGVTVPTLLHHLEESKVETDKDTLHTIYNSLVYQYALAPSTPSSLSADPSGDEGLWGRGDKILEIDSKGYASLVYTDDFESGSFIYDALSSAGLDVQTLSTGGKIPLFHSKAMLRAVTTGGNYVMIAVNGEIVMGVWVGGPNPSGGGPSAYSLPDSRFIYGAISY